MEINLPTASPFFSGLPNQIMYCISTPTYAGYSTDPKKLENSHQQVVVSQANQYYYNQHHALPPPPPPPIQTFTPVQPTEEFKPPIYDMNSIHRNQNRFFEEEGRNFECSVVKIN